jgi:AraC-like DNA-binding protein
MSRRTALWSTHAISAHRFDHAPEEHDHGPVDEVGQSFSASFVESGRFDLEVGHRRWRLGPGDVLLIHPGMRFRIAHEHGDLSDVCLSVTYDAAAIDGFDRKQTWARAATPVLRADNRLRYLHWAMRKGLDENVALLAESCASELFREIPESRNAMHREYGTRTFRVYLRRIHDARERIDLDFDQALRLDALARDAGMSSFHFARLFAELVGAPPHRYLLETRLRVAREMLRQGRSVTDTCYACGFNQLSHFSRTFSRRYGCAPSAWRNAD